MDAVALVCFVTAAVLFAWDYNYVRQGGMSDGMFFMLNGKTWSFFFRKIMVALAVVWMGCFLTFLRNAKGFPTLPVVFLMAGFVIVPLMYFNQISILPNPMGIKNAACADIIGGSDGPTSIYVATKFRWPFSKEPLKIITTSDEPITRSQKTRQQVEALHKKRLWKKFPEARPYAAYRRP
jgi:hypothetical protein